MAFEKFLSQNKLLLLLHILAASNRQMNEKKKGKKETIRQVEPADGQTCHADLYYFCPLRGERERGDESKRTCVEVTGVCPSPLRLLHLSGI